MQLNTPLNISFEEYRKAEGLNASSIVNIAISPKHYKYFLDNQEKEETKSQRLGSALHCRLLEPDRFEKDYAVCPCLDMRKTESKNCMTAFALKHAGKTIINEEEYETIVRMTANVMITPLYEKLLIAKGNKTEQSIFWKNKNGTLLKARVDLFNEKAGLLCDVKTTRNIGRDLFGKDFQNFGYGLSLAHYREALRACGMQVDSTFILAIENEAPHDSALVVIQDHIMDAHKERMEDYIAEIEKCRDQGVWEGVAKGSITDLKLSNWYLSQLGIEE